ncbi:MAG TPA: redoxin domain-containing protein [Chthonomonadaceae bacterium]|nr:redoxin domain-containing protein [Chthonomonadaceae bacterium]
MRTGESISRWGIGGLAAIVAVTAGIGAFGGQTGEGAKSAGRAGTTQAAPLRLRFTDLAGKSYGQAEIAAHKATIFLILSAQCPVCNVYAPRLAGLAETYGNQGVAVYGVYPDRQETAGEITRSAQERALTFPIIKDSKGALADRLGATTTPQAIVVDATGVVRYRGRIDDNSVATKITSHDLTDALDALLAGNPVPHPQTEAFGCAIRRTSGPVAAASGVPTYATHVAAILRAKCETCHRPGEVAPFSLQTYEQASAWAADIKRYTANRQMPPWKPVANYGVFQEEHERTLTDAERTTLAKWADAGAPLGDPKQVPPPRSFPQGWRIGQPDLIITPEKEYHLTADGDDVYRNFVIKTNFTEDRYISGIEAHPGNRAIVHHIIAYIDGNPANGVYASDKLDGKDNDGQPGYTSFGGPGFVPAGILGGWVPGNDPHILSDGLAVFIPKGARLVLQVHYHKDGKPETDKTQIGLRFCRTTVEKLVQPAFGFNFGFKIPPGDPHYEVRNYDMTIGEDSHAIAITPHMHLLGREMKVWATLPDGTEKPLVWINDWDFNWQGTYWFQDPVALPKGTKIHLISNYDNSPQNLRNPNRTHPKEVGWGEQTTDEMCVVFMALTHDSEHLALKPTAPNQTIAAKTP